MEQWTFNTSGTYEWAEAADMEAEIEVDSGYGSCPYC
jgi:hypothetical protein